MDGFTIGLMTGFVHQFEQSAIKSESHPNSRWELAEGTTIIFNAFGSDAEADEAGAVVTFVLSRNDDGKFKWSFEVDESTEHRKR